MQYIGYIFFRFLVFIFSLIPFWALYFYSDILYFFFFHVFGYRKKIVYNNLRKSFPDKADKEIHSIAKKFYTNLSDITLESIKGLSMSKKTLLKRYPVLNIELLDEFFNKGQNVIGLAAHYTNWEWGVISFGFQFKHKSVGLYKPLSNKYIDSYVKKSRAAWGMNLVPIKDTFKAFNEKHEKPAVFFMVSDQSPSNVKKAVWVKFLNQDTACLHGAENYAVKFNVPMVFGNVQRVKRGYYTVELSIFEKNPAQTKPQELTQRYMQKLEKIIKENPENWLWSHKRWKHKRETV
ncbi:MAG: lysophospholipid acyltransferase family protein [Bacteroidales bacterium]|nr:lysophospholipid acyltransferase family protein [Bacteroidales bacterium]